MSSEVEIVNDELWGDDKAAASHTLEIRRVREISRP